MLTEITRFNRLATRHGAVQRGGDGSNRRSARSSTSTVSAASSAQWYLLPMIGCIWSCRGEQMLAFPVATLIRFCHNHGLLQVADRPQWMTVRGGSRQYVRRIVDRLARRPAAVRRCWASSGSRPARWCATANGTEHFDAGRLRLPQRPGLAPAGCRCNAGRSAGARRHPAISRTGPCCTPTHRCCRRGVRRGPHGTTSPRMPGMTLRLPALPHQPTAAAALAAAGHRLAQSVARAPCRDGDPALRLRPPGVRRRRPSPRSGGCTRSRANDERGSAAPGPATAFTKTGLSAGLAVAEAAGAGKQRCRSEASREPGARR